MDLVAACRVFVQVGERGSFTLGAAAAGVPQPVASRRVAALERHFDQRLFDRTGRLPALTAFGRDMLGPAKRLVEMADGLTDAAEQARLNPLTVAVPEDVPIRERALLSTAAYDDGTVLELRGAGRADRGELLRARLVRVAVMPVAPAEADWTVRLGVATAGPAGGRRGPLRIETLRASRTRPLPRRMWLQPEDDTPHIRDVLIRAGARAGLLPVQLAVAASLTAAVTDVLRTANLLICSPRQADGLGLNWRPIHTEHIARGYRVQAAEPGEADDLRGRWSVQMAACLGAE